MLIDSHAHLDSKEFETDREDVIKRSEANRLNAIISCGTTLASSEENVTLAQQHSIVFAAVGIHPHESYQIEETTLPSLKRLATQHKKIVAIGETGLDYHYNFSLPEVQRKAFRLHVQLARELRLPLIIHCRNAEDDIKKILWEEKAQEAGGVIHSFTGDRAMARACTDMGFYLGVSGIATFKSAGALASMFAEVPLECLLLETDSPYLAPVPMRGKRNEPSFVAHTAAKLAELKGVSVDVIHAATTQNSEKLFHFLKN